MFCPKCGTQNVQTVNFCRSCGANLGNVSEALSGTLHKPQMILNKKGKPVNYESAITKMFSGLAFLIVAIVLAVSGIAGGQFWWFWLLIPAFGSLGSGVAQYVQLKKSEGQNVSFASNSQNVFNSNPQNASLPPPQTNLNEIHNLVNSGDKLMAIKRYRETYNVGLKEAKDAVEQIERGQMPSIPQPKIYNQSPSGKLDEIRNLVNSGNKIMAIKRYREICNVGLREAKEAVDAMELGQMPPTNSSYNPPPRGSIYDTGELTPPSSVTENTTRHLELDSEGDTMTLPKK